MRMAGRREKKEARAVCRLDQSVRTRLDTGGELGDTQQVRCRHGRQDELEAAAADWGAHPLTRSCCVEPQGPPDHSPRGPSLRNPSSSGVLLPPLFSVQASL